MGRTGEVGLRYRAWLWGTYDSTIFCFKSANLVYIFHILHKSEI